MRGGLPLGRRRWQGLFILPVLLVLFLVLKSFGLNYAVSDENIYFYDAWLMTQGYWPYRDFFFAHPPLHLVPGWLLFSVAGFTFAGAKLLPVAAACVTGVCVYFITRPSVGKLGAAVAMLLFLFSHDLLRASSHWTGINWSVAWMCAGLLAALRSRVQVSAVLFALGSCTGAYVIPGALTAALLIGMAHPRRGLRFGAVFLATFGVINLGFWAFGGEGFIDGVYRYHLLKQPIRGASLFGQLDQLLFHNFFLLVSPVCLAPIGAWWMYSHARKEPWHRGVRGAFDPKVNCRVATGLWSIAFCAAYFLFMAQLKQVYHFYFLLLFPTCAVTGGIFAALLVDSLRGAVRSSRQRISASLMLSVLVIGFLVYPLFEHNLGYFSKNQGRTFQYELPRSRLPAALQGLAKRLVWQPDRTVGRRYSGVQYYLWHESRAFNAATEIAARLRRDCNPGEAIFGDSTTTPLVALLAGVPIVDRMVDTNAARFRSGITPASDVVERLAATFDRTDERLTWVLVRPGHGFYNIDEFRRFVDTHFRPTERFSTRYHGTIVLLRRTQSDG